MYKVDIKEVYSTKNASSFLQSDFWARFKEKHGWAPHHLCVEYQDEESGGGKSVDG